MRNLFFFLGLALLLGACQEELQYTSDGYRYEMHVDADGPAPQPGEYVYFHAQIRNGDSVYYATRTMQPETPFQQIPVTTTPAGEGSPIVEVLSMMSVGDSATVFIRLDTLPAERKPQGFEDAEFLYQDLVVTDIKSQEEYEEIAAKQREEAIARRQEAQGRFEVVQDMAQKTAADYAAGELAGELQTTPSGLKYIIQEEGTGEQAEAGKVVSVHYYGMLTDGAMFDNSFQRGDLFPFRLGVGQVIPGWDEGIALLKEGAKAMLFIPSDLAYGAQGSPPVIPPDSELIFYVELEDVQ